MNAGGGGAWTLSARQSRAARPISSPVAPPAIPDAPAASARLTPLNTLPITRQTAHPPDARLEIGGVSRAAKGADVNPLADAFVGSSPTSPTMLRIKDNPSISRPHYGPFSCRVCRMIFSSNFNGPQALPKTPRNMNAT